MKKLLLILSIFVVSLPAIAADLNPFAYGLKSSVNALNPMQLDIQFSINAPATSVKVVVYDIATKTDVYTYSCTAYNAKHDYALSLDLSNIPGQYRGGVDNLGWRVDVKGAEVGSPTFVKNDVRLYAPTSVDIDNNPENENFGTVFVVEGKPDARGNATYSSYLSYKDGAGLYLFNADGTARPMPNRVGQYGYNGGRVQQTRQYFNGSTSGGFAPYRVRVSDDGRIFISSMTPDGEVLWEADPLVFSRPDAPDWETRAGAGWSHVMSSKNANTVMGTTKRNCSHVDCGIYHLYQNDAGGPFIAGPNMGFDVRGSGKDLKLLMLAGCKQAIVHSTPAHFYCDEYDLGEAKMWNTPPSRRIFAGHSNGIAIVNAYGVQVQYDKSGNVWMCQHRAGTTETTLARVNRALSSTKVYNVNEGQVDYSESDHTYRRCGAIRFNEDFTQVAIASNANPTAGNNQGGGFTVYPVDQSTGLPIWNSGTQVNTNSKTGYSLMDFAWDYAGNLYIAADASTNGERIAVYAMPHAADRVVSTPAASRFAFEVNCASDESYLINVVTADANQGSATITAGFDAEGKVPSCTPVEVFAQSNDGYKFVCWKEGDVEVSRENPYTFSAVKDITLTAHFEVGEYNVTWWNLLANNYDYDITDDVIDLDRNKLLYDLFRPLYNTYHKVKNNPKNLRSQQTPAEFTNGDMNVIGFVYEECPGIMQDDQSPVKWIGDYLSYVAEQQGKVWNKEKYLAWGVHLFAFMNRSNTGRNSGGVDLKDYTVTGLNGYPDYTGEYGLPDKWRPWWTSIGCGLPNTMKYSSSMPSSFTQIQPTSGAIYTLNSNIVPQGTPTWYQWNTAPRADQLLAWRDGSITGDIVHHVYRDNMKLYATYVDAHLQENDPQPDLSKNPYDATNNDVLDLLVNENHGSTLLNFTIDRKFVGGMYNTVCFPFDIPISKLPEELKNADIRVFSGVSENNQSGETEMVLSFITLEEYWVGKDNYFGEPYMEAGVPYLIKPNVDVNADYLTYSGLLYWYFFNSSRTPNANTVGSVSFHGVLNPTDLPENAYILVANNRLAKVTDGNEKMKGFRGYFTWDDPVRMPPAKISISVGKQVTTDVEEIVDDQITQPAAPKVRKVMYDGQIYILRGEEVYTITGNRVK